MFRINKEKIVSLHNTQQLRDYFAIYINTNQSIAS